MRTLLVLFLSPLAISAKELYPNSLQAQNLSKTKIEIFSKSTKSSPQASPKLPPVDLSPGAYTKLRLEDIFYQPHLDTGYQPIRLEASLSEPISLDLEYVLTKALEDNLNLNISRENTNLAKWKFWQQFAEALPDLSLVARKKSLDGTFYLNSRLQVPIDENQAQTQFRVSHRAFSGGKTSFLTMAEHYYKTAAAQDEQEQYNLVLLKSLEYYNDLLKDQVKLSSKLKAIEEAQSNFQRSQQFYKVGRGTKFDVLQAEARLAKAQQDMIEQEARYRMSEINLAEHLNLPLTAPIKAIEDSLTGISKLELIPVDFQIQDFINTAMKFNPRVAAALKRKSASSRELIASYGDLLPKIDIYADFTATGQEFSDLNNISTLAFETSLELGRGSGLSPLADIMRARASSRKSRLQHEQEKLRTEKELRMAFLNFEKSKSLLSATEIELTASREALRLSKLRYENGLEIFANVLEREKYLSEVESKMIDSIAAYNLAQAQLLYLMGTISPDKLLVQASSP